MIICCSSVSLLPTALAKSASVILLSPCSSAHLRMFMITGAREMKWRSTLPFQAIPVPAFPVYV